eukprot:17488-Prymnesium_polylepis.1
MRPEPVRSVTRARASERARSYPIGPGNFATRYTIERSVITRDTGDAPAGRGARSAPPSTRPRE